MKEKLNEIKNILITAKKDDINLDLLMSDAKFEEKSKTIAAAIRYKHEIFPELMLKATKLNESLFNKEIEFYAVSYIADLCVNNCAYCGHASSVKQEREILTPEDIALDFESRLKFGPTEICILAGQHPSIDVKFLKEARDIALEQDIHNALTSICFNVAPMKTEDYRELKQGLPNKTQIRVFQESYDRMTYLDNHPCGPKRNFDFRLGSQERALQAGIKLVGIGALLGINEENSPYKHFGNDFEIMSMIMHSHYLKESYGVSPNTASIPRHQKSPGSDFETPNPVDDLRYIMYHAILRLALPSTKLIVTNREREAMRDILRPMINIEDLAARPGVGGNYRSETHFQNELGDVRTPLELIKDIKDKGYKPMVKF